jgi:hypothetical protein
MRGRPRASRRRRRRTSAVDDNLVVVVKRKVSCPKGNPSKPCPPKDHFEKLLDAPCLHHEVPVKHALKDCRLIKNYVNDTLKPRAVNPPKKAGLPPNNDDDAGVMYPGEDGVVHVIFSGSPARPSRCDALGF